MSSASAAYYGLYLSKKQVVIIIRINYKEDLEKVANPDIVRYIKEEIECISEEFGYEDEFDSFTFYDLGEMFIVEREDEVPLHLPFEFVTVKKVGDTSFFTAVYLRTNDDPIEYIIPFDILDDEIKALLEDET